MIIEKQKIIKVLENKKVICWSDLLQELDLIPLFKKYKETHNNESYSIQKVYMGKTLMNWCDSILKARIVNTKDKRVSHLKEKYRLSEYGMDCLQSMPVEKEDIDYMLLEDL